MMEDTKHGSDHKSEAESKEDWVHLTTVSNDIEYNITKGLLETANIPSIRKLKGIDGLIEIVIGVPIAGIEVWVPKDRYEEADQLLQAQVLDDEFDGEEDGEPGK